MSTVSRTREDFVQLWGELGSFWGVSPAAARIFAWLYSRARPADAEDLMAGLGLSRGAVSMGCRELRDWGLLRAVKEPGVRRGLYRAETDLEKAIRNIVQTRMRREWTPLLDNLEQWIADLDQARSSDGKAFRQRLKELHALIRETDSMAALFLEGGPVQRLGLKFLVAAARTGSARRRAKRR